MSELAARIAPRSLLPPVISHYRSAVGGGTNCVVMLFQLVSDAIAKMPKDGIKANHHRLFKFFLVSFDLRREEAGGEDALEGRLDLEAVESASTKAFVQLVMRLSETLFRPVFLKAFDWALTMPTEGAVLPITLKEDADEDEEEGGGDAGEEGGSQVDVGRSTLFYRLMHTMALQLKGLIVPYFGHLVDPVVLLLQALTPSLATTPHRNKRRKADPDTAEDQASPDVAAHAALLPCILDALQACALYDTVNLLDNERFPKLVEPVAAQLENYLGGEEEYKRRVECHVIPCLVQFAITVHDDQLWKPLHHAVLRRTRSDNPSVRLAALTVVHQFFNRLGEAYMVMLPETVPYLSELMEDDHPEVEALCQKVIKDIEQVSGESLQEYFT